jgi:hypothetical protein
MPMETVPASGEDFRYALVSYDRDGAERPEGGALFSAEVADMLAGRPFSDVILVSHWWNGDLPAAREQYTRWFTTMLGRAADRAALTARPAGFRPLVVGLHCGRRSPVSGMIAAGTQVAGVHPIPAVMTQLVRGGVSVACITSSTRGCDPGCPRDAVHGGVKGSRCGDHEARR